MATSDTLTGSLFAARYRISRKIGGGGMADVYLAEDQELGRRVAVKILHERYANDDQFVERFRREATHAAGLSHPNIVSIYDRGETNGSYFIVMEYVEGRTLKDLIRSRGPCPTNVAIAYTRQILAALRYAHRNGVIHRDIKPHNVIVDPEGVVKVTDFGIARAGASQMTEEGAIIGTAQYLSPEQARGAPVDQTSDLYSTGIVLYELLTGTVPFSGETPVEIAMKHLTEIPEPPSEHRPEVPDDLDLVVVRALAKEPADRYQSAAAMDADLETVAHGGHVPVETAEAATIVLSGARSGDGATGVTHVARRRGGPPQAPYEPRARKRALWPWLLGVGVAARRSRRRVSPFRHGPAAARRSRNGGRSVRRRHRACARGQPDTRARARATGPQRRELGRGGGSRLRPKPDGGDERREGNRRDDRCLVWKTRSHGPERCRTVPCRRSRGADRRWPRCTGRRSRLRQGPGTVTGQSPPAGTVVVEGTQVRINVSRGPKPITVPNVIGLPYEQAASELQRAGFGVARVDVDSELAKGIVQNQDPNGGSSSSKGSTVTLSVSRGPVTTSVPDVTNQDVSIAEATLETAGFRTRTVLESTDDPTLDGIVISQDPLGGTQGQPTSVVTLFVGRFTDTSTETTPVP